MESAVIYPYSKLSTPILRQLAYDHEFNIVSAVMLGTWYRSGVDASFLDEGKMIGVEVHNNFEEEVDKCSTIIWALYEYSDKAVFEQVVQKMKAAMAKGKNIICQQILDYEMQRQFAGFSEKNGVKFEYQYAEYTNQKQIVHTYSVNNAPIITVTGIGENCSKFETQLMVYRVLKESGYNVSVIGSRQGCGFLGIHDFPSFMFSPMYSETDKINNFRSYVCKLEKDEKPDVIIIGVPGGIMPLNERHNMGFGIICYEVLNAIKSDFNIFNLWCEDYNNEFLKEMENVMKYRFNTPIDCFCFSNVRVDYESQNDDRIQYEVLDAEFVNQKMLNITDFASINLLNIQSSVALKEKILLQLVK